MSQGVHQNPLTEAPDESTCGISPRRALQSGHGGGQSGFCSTLDVMRRIPPSKKNPLSRKNAVETVRAGERRLRLPSTTSICHGVVKGKCLCRSSKEPAPRTRFAVRLVGTGGGAERIAAACLYARFADCARTTRIHDETLKLSPPRRGLCDAWGKLRVIGTGCDCGDRTRSLSRTGFQFYDTGPPQSQRGSSIHSWNRDGLRHRAS
jgi:hypothetical protein